MIKRLFCILLAVLLLLGVLPTAANAAEDTVIGFPASAATLLCRAFGGEAEDASLFEGGAEQSEAEGVTPFVDVPADAYFADAVRWAAESGVTNGTDETHFSPDAPCLRCQIVTFLCRAVRHLESVGDEQTE